MKSLLTIPIFYKTELVGFIGFDAVKNFKEYNDFEVETLREFGLIFLQTEMRLNSEKKEKLVREKLDFVINASEIGIWEWNLKTNTAIFNEYWAKMLGYKLEELDQSIDTWKSLSNPDDLEISLQLLEDTFYKKTSRYEANVRMLHKNGHYIWVKDSGKVTEWDGDTPIKMIGTHIDITSYVEAKELNIIVKEALDKVPYYFITLDENFNILFINKKTREDLLINVEKITGKNLFDVIDNANVKLHLPIDKNDIAKKQGFSGDIEVVFPNKNVKWFKTIMTPIKDEEDNTIRFVISGFDKTAVKQEEEALSIAKKHLEDELAFNLEAIKNTTVSAVLALANLTENRDQETHAHLERVQFLTKSLAFLMSREEKYQYLIDKRFVDSIFYASALHDIGKIVIPDKILFNDTELTAEERLVMESHTTFGAKTLNNMIKLFPNSYEIVMAAEIAAGHHENFDGSGYPNKISGEDIPLSARIMTIIDVYDALRSKRRYKDALSHKAALEILNKESGVKFDPEIVKIFIKNGAQFKMLYESI